ncbi:FAD-dependent monooxygenase [Kitasatospora sp. NPDC101235]|uniref:FAD-dependent monooxygenase n=1 Tax=Kitasatospora sp. NPDC101235 TaxID=3364101 RepID=UPI0038076AED
MSTDQRPRIAVVGGGIAGLTAAACLLRAGLRCTVFEQASAFADAGAGIQLAPNSVRILHRLGLAEALDLRATRATAIETRRWQDGGLLARTELGTHCETAYGAPYYLIQRADLHRSLLELLPPDVVRHGAVCDSVVESDGGAVLHFRDGTAERADVVVAADGIHSAIRGTLIDDGPRFSGHTVYRGLVPADRLPGLFDEPKVVFWLGPGGHVTSYPIAGHKLVHFSAVTTSPGWNPAVWRAQARVEEAAAAFAGWGEEVRRLIDAADEVHHWALFDRPRTLSWNTDRIALVGDAAHPMLPYLSQGANQAIEDAAVLAALLPAGGPAPAQALGTYTALREPRAGEVHRRSRERGLTFHFPDGPDQRSRDAAMPEAERLSAYGWLYGYDAETAAQALTSTGGHGGPEHG